MTTALEVDFVKAGFTAEAWAKAIENPVNKKILSCVKTKNGQRIDLAGRNDFGFSVDRNSVSILIDGAKYPIQSAHSQNGITLLFHEHGIEALKPKVDSRNPFKRSTQFPYTEHSVTFTFDDVRAFYDDARICQTIQSVIVDDTVERHISLEGRCPDSYNFATEKGKLLLAFKEKSFPVQFVQHKNGTVLSLSSEGLRILAPSFHDNFIQQVQSRPQAQPNPKTLDEEALLSGIIRGDVACFATYMQRHRSKFIKTILKPGTISEAEAEDSLQTFMLKQTEKMIDGTWSFGGDDPDKMRRWISVAIANARTDILRYHKRDDSIFTDDCAYEFNDGGEIRVIDNSPDLGFGPDQQAASREFIEKYLALINQLPNTRQKEYLLGIAELRFGNEQAAIEDYLKLLRERGINITAGTIRTSLCRMREILERQGLGMDVLRTGNIPSALRPV